MSDVTGDGDNAVRRVEHAMAAALAPLPATIYVGYSGGVDSSVLLDAAARCRAGHTQVHAVHVNHGLHADAAAWERHCAAVCAQANVPFVSARVEVALERNVEAAARSARYQVFQRLLRAGDVLLLGHHRDDQIETLLLRLVLRGGGAELLAGMRGRRPLGKGELVRPFLALPRATLQAYARDRGLHCLEDPSNANLRFDRGFLRSRILPQLAARWPGAAHSMARAAVRLRQDAVLVERGLDQALAECAVEAITPAQGGAPALAVEQLLVQPAPARVLRRWLARHGLHEVAERSLDEYVAQIQRSPDRHPELRAGPACSVRRFRGLLHLLPDRARQPTGAGMSWRLGEALVLSSGVLSAVRVPGPGLDGDVDALRLEYGALSQRMRPAGRTHSRTVQRLLQEAGVPPWLRAAWPQLFRGTELVAVPGIAIAATHVRESHDNWQLQWRPATLQEPH
jgi:tRNA(Ile)-lysidine synthase